MRNVHLPCSRKGGSTLRQAAWCQPEPKACTWGWWELEHRAAVAWSHGLGWLGEAATALARYASQGLPLDWKAWLAHERLCGPVPLSRGRDGRGANGRAEIWPPSICSRYSMEQVSTTSSMVPLACKLGRIWNTRWAGPQHTQVTTHHGAPTLHQGSGPSRCRPEERAPLGSLRGHLPPPAPGHPCHRRSSPVHGSRPLSSTPHSTWLPSPLSSHHKALTTQKDDFEKTLPSVLPGV